MFSYHSDTGDSLYVNNCTDYGIVTTNKTDQNEVWCFRTNNSEIISTGVYKCTPTQSPLCEDDFEMTHSSSPVLQGQGEHSSVQSVSNELVVLPMCIAVKFKHVTPCSRQKNKHDIQAGALPREPTRNSYLTWYTEVNRAETCLSG